MVLEKPSARIIELGVGSLFGELALITDKPRTADVIAKTDVDLMVIDKERFFEQLRKDPENAIRLLRIVSERFWESRQESAKA